TSVLCSATLASQGNFSFAKSRFGIGKEEDGIIEKIYHSPFHYETQVLFGCPVDMPEPDNLEFFKELACSIFALVQASRGNAFVLFTSYESLISSYEALYERLTNLGFHCLKQGDAHRHILLKKFKETPCSVLFGTDSFWEGVDIQGDALRLVIITKLPF